MEYVSYWYPRNKTLTNDVICMYIGHVTMNSSSEITDTKLLSYTSAGGGRLVCDTHICKRTC